MSYYIILYYIILYYINPKDICLSILMTCHKFLMTMERPFGGFALRIKRVVFLEATCHFEGVLWAAVTAGRLPPNLVVSCWMSCGGVRL